MYRIVNDLRSSVIITDDDDGLVATRSSRPIKTVVLVADQKERFLADVNEYLKPSTSRWYANRRIPYRRGYLFSNSMIQLQ